MASTGRDPIRWPYGRGMRVRVWRWPVWQPSAGNGWCCAMCFSTFRRVLQCCCWGRTGRARARCCEYWPGLKRPDAGTIHWNGVDIAGRPGPGGLSRPSRCHQAQSHRHRELARAGCPHRSGARRDGPRGAARPAGAACSPPVSAAVSRWPGWRCVHRVGCGCSMNRRSGSMRPRSIALACCSPPIGGTAARS